MSQRSTADVTGDWGKNDEPSNQKNDKAWKMLENAAESPASGARFVGLPFA